MVNVRNDMQSCDTMVCYYLVQFSMVEIVVINFYDNLRVIELPCLSEDWPIELPFEIKMSENHLFKLLV